MSLLEKNKLFLSNEILMFEFAHRVKKIHTEETSCLGGCDCAIMDFIDPIIICFQKNISLNEKTVFFIVQCLRYRGVFEFLSRDEFESNFFCQPKKS